MDTGPGAAGPRRARTSPSSRRTAAESGFVRATIRSPPAASYRPSSRASGAGPGPVTAPTMASAVCRYDW
ncbi:hypothetical protein SFR_6961 (plasmid) [Streptomyces sp. FR-008]|nr:hypothetical protein SFR_6961 [Streptomyces sp. FR-008]